jgi:lysyl-tRNA synthetase class 1
MAYYEDFVKPSKRYRAPDELERSAMEALATKLQSLPEDADAEEIQNEVYATGREFEFKNLRDWFRALYEVLFGQEQGPRMGSFIALYGRDETVSLIKNALDRGKPKQV